LVDRVQVVGGNFEGEGLVQDIVGTAPRVVEMSYFCYQSEAKEADQNIE
jgi:hypothetical protein